jgi:hypothetical protein
MSDKKRVDWFFLAAWGFVALFVAMSWYGIMRLIVWMWKKI